MKAALAAALLLAGCAAAPSGDGPAPVAPAAAPPAIASKPAGTPLHCEDGSVLATRFHRDEGVIAGLPGGDEKVLRDAGGVTPRHSVWSNPRVRAEFGLGEQGDEAAIHLLEGMTRTLHCRAGG